MNRVYVLHESVDWYGPLDRALTQAGVPHGEIFLSSGALDLTQPPPEGVFFNRLSGTAHTRGHVLAVEYARAVLHWLEAHGRRVVNSRQALELAMSKTALIAALDASGIRVPRTVAAIGLSRLSEAGRRMDGPFLVKPNRSGKGIGIQLFNSADELTAAVDSGELGESSDGVFVERTTCEVCWDLYAVPVEHYDRALAFERALKSGRLPGVEKVQTRPGKIDNITIEVKIACTCKTRADLGYTSPPSRCAELVPDRSCPFHGQR